MGFEQLREILEDNRRIVREEEAKPIEICPECAFPILKENKKGEKLCPLCGWQEKL